MTLWQEEIYSFIALLLGLLFLIGFTCAILIQRVVTKTMRGSRRQQLKAHLKRIAREINEVVEQLEEEDRNGKGSE